MYSAVNGWTWALFDAGNSNIHDDLAFFFGGRLVSVTNLEARSQAHAHLDDKWDIGRDDIVETHIHRGDFTPVQVLAS